MRKEERNGEKGRNRGKKEKETIEIKERAIEWESLLSSNKEDEREKVSVVCVRNKKEEDDIHPDHFFLSFFHYPFSTLR